MLRSSAILAVVALATLPFGVAHAQTAQEKISEQQFLSRIDGALPELELHDAAVTEAQADVEDTRSLPPLDLHYEREEVFTGGEAVALTSALSVGWSLDVSGGRGRRVKSAEHALRATRVDSEYGKLLTTLAALETYKRAARARLRVESLQRTRAPLADLVTRLENRVREGDASGYDLTRFQLELSDHDQLLAEASAEQTIREAELAALLGVPAGQVGASDDLELPTEPAGQAAEGVTRGDLLATQYLESSGKALQQAAARWWIPRLDLSVGYLSADLGPGSGPGADVVQGYTAAVSAAIPLFTRGGAEKLRGAARIQEARARHKLLERQVRTEVQTARTRLHATLEQARAFEQAQLVQSAALVEKTEAAYQGGEATALELRDAYARASAASLRYIELRYAAGLAEIALWSATGWIGRGKTSE